jgi:hypothetical protein
MRCLFVPRVRQGFLAGILAMHGALGCQWGSSLGSDPAAWSPPPAPVADADSDALASVADGAGGGDDADCTDEPPFDSTLQKSSAALRSHLPGHACLTACHARGGSARTVFAAAGTVYRSQTSRNVAAAGGQVQQVGGSTLTLDRCGNFYAIAAALNADPGQTQPVVQNPALHQMQKILYRQADPGNCNQAGCHDFSGPLNWGIYY